MALKLIQIRSARLSGRNFAAIVFLIVRVPLRNSWGVNKTKKAALFAPFPLFHPKEKELPDTRESETSFVTRDSKLFVRKRHKGLNFTSPRNPRREGSSLIILSYILPTPLPEYTFRCANRSRPERASAFYAILIILINRDP